MSDEKISAIYFECFADLKKKKKKKREKKNIKWRIIGSPFLIYPAENEVEVQ